MSQRTIDVTTLIDGEPVGRLQLLVMLLCAVVVVLDGFDVQAIAFTGPAIADEFGIAPASMGALFAAGLIGMVVGTLVVGPLGDLLGRKPAILVSVAAFGFFSLSTVMARNLQDLIILRFLTGVGLGGAIPNLTALVAEFAPLAWRAVMISVIFLGIPLGGLFGGMLTAELIPRLGWRAIFVIGGVLPLVVGGVLVVLLPESIRYLAARGGGSSAVGRTLSRMYPGRGYSSADRFVVAEAPQQGFPVRRLLTEGRARDTLLLWLAFFMNLMVVYYLISWVPSLIVHAGFGIEKGALAAVALNLGGLAGCLALPALVRRFGSKAVIRAGFGIGAVGVAAMGQATSLVAILVMTFIGGFFTFGTQVALNAFAASLYPTEIRATGVGWAFGVGRIGSVLGPVIGGFFLAFGWETPAYFLFFGGFLAVAAAGVSWIRHDDVSGGGAMRPPTIEDVAGHPA